MFCITYDTTCYADPQRAFDFFMRQLREFLGLAPRVRRNKRIVSHPQPHKVGKYRAPHLRPDPHPHLPRDRLQEYHSEPESHPKEAAPAPMKRRTIATQTTQTKEITYA